MLTHQSQHLHSGQINMLNGYKTYSGLAITLIGLAAQVFEVDMTPGEIEGIVEAIIGFVGIAIAVYGRWDKGRRSQSE